MRTTFPIYLCITLGAQLRSSEVGLAGTIEKYDEARNSLVFKHFRFLRLLTPQTSTVQTVGSSGVPFVRKWDRPSSLRTQLPARASSIYICTLCVGVGVSILVAGVSGHEVSDVTRLADVYQTMLLASARLSCFFITSTISGVPSKNISSRY